MFSKLCWKDWFWGTDSKLKLGQKQICYDNLKCWSKIDGPFALFLDFIFLSQVETLIQAQNPAVIFNVVLKSTNGYVIINARRVTIYSG